MLAAGVALAHTFAMGARAAAAATPEQVAAGAPSTQAVGTAPTPAAPPAPQPSPPGPPVPIALSNERTLTTWAHPLEEVSIRARPLAGSRTVGRTHLATEDGFPEVYLLLASVTDARGRSWVQLRIPARPNGRTGWVPREALSEFHITHQLLVIGLRARRITLYDNGKRRFSAPAGVGKPSTPTPPGHFWVREIFRVERDNPYWPYAIGTSAYSRLTDWPGGGVVGIHGDLGEPQLIPGDPSHGCVRLRNADIARLAPRLQLGTPVDIVR
jgi:hypothetical protein